MEGHRHEKVAIIICAYIIGFSTAFIGFGVNALQNTEVQKKSMTAEVVKVAEVPKADIQKNVITSISFGGDGLYAVTPAGNILLSVNKSALEASVIGATRNSGYYFAIVDAEASRDGKFAYFCEQLMENDTTCDPFVYDLQGDILHKVLKDGNAITLDVKSHASSWNETGFLTTNGAMSISAEKPWQLAEVQNQQSEEPEITTEEAQSQDPEAEEMQVQ